MGNPAGETTGTPTIASSANSYWDVNAFFPEYLRMAEMRHCGRKTRPHSEYRQHRSACCFLAEIAAARAESGLAKAFRGFIGHDPVIAK